MPDHPADSLITALFWLSNLFCRSFEYNVTVLFARHFVMINNENEQQTFVLQRG